jgi:hypothetical protein
MLQQSQFDPIHLVGGSRWVYLEEEVREQLDRLLAGLEESSSLPAAAASAAAKGAAGNDSAAAATTMQDAPDITGTLLVLGGSILHSRMSTSMSRLLLHHLQCRPLGAAKLRTLPLCFEGGVWQHVLFLRMRHHVLVVSLALEGSVLSLARATAGGGQMLLDFEEVFVERMLTTASSSLHLPVEEAPVLLRHYTGHDTLAFLYHHHATGVAVAPPPRSAQAMGFAAASSASAAAASAAAAAASSNGAAAKPAEAVGSSQQEANKTLQVFSWFFAKAKSVCVLCNWCCHWAF